MAIYTAYIGLVRVLNDEFMSLSFMSSNFGTLILLWKNNAPTETWSDTVCNQHIILLAAPRSDYSSDYHYIITHPASEQDKKALNDFDVRRNIILKELLGFQFPFILRNISPCSSVAATS